MTVATEVDRDDYVGNGAVSSYSYTFKILTTSDLLVTTVTTLGVESTLTLTTDYTVSGAGQASGGTISLVNGPLTSGYGLTIKRGLTVTQATALAGQRQFFASSVEAALDRLCMVDQMLADGVARSIRIPDTEDGADYNLILPSEANRKSSALVFDSNGDIAVSPLSSSISNLVSGEILYGGAAGLVAQSTSLVWDNTNRILGVSSNLGTCIQLKHRVTGDGLTPDPIDGSGYLNIMNPVDNRTFSFGFYTYGALVRFNGNQNGVGQSGLEFWGVDGIAAAGAASPIMTMNCSTADHEVHCPRGNTDIDAIIHAIPVGFTPVIYTESGGNNMLDFGVSRKRLFRITTGGATGTGNVFWTMAASAADKNLTYEFRDNTVTGTLKGRLIYAGSNATASKYFGVINDAADYFTIASTSTIFYNSTFGTEYCRWTATDYRPGAAATFDLGTSGKEWKSIYFGTQAFAGAGTAGNPAYSFSSGTNYGFLFSAAGNYVGLSLNGTLNYLWNLAQGFWMKSTQPISWDNADGFGSVSLQISRDAANILALKNSNSAQTFRVYAGNGDNLGIVTVNESLTVASAATTVAATTIPAGAIILSVSCRVTTVIPTATTFSYATTTGGTALNTAAVSTAATSTDVGTKAGAFYQSAATTVTVTPSLTPATGTGVIRLCYKYILVTPPTS